MGTPGRRRRPSHARAGGRQVRAAEERVCGGRGQPRQEHPLVHGVGAQPQRRARPDGDGRRH
eukprot:4994313-Prymnesium_polylepis.1